MKIEKFENKLLNETVYCARHPSGLEIRVMPKSGYKSAFAMFAVKYGSIDTFLQQEDGSFTPIPEGTAHFLEHKLFESEELDAFKLFEKTGAYANAYTSFEQTAYLFKGSENIMQSLGYLLDFVQHPYFTAETVQKEQGIIGQEIRMYLDDPEWVIMLNLLKALYKDNPVRVDIAGTQESISHIDDKLLYSLYNSFYNPSNMILTVVGSVDPDEIFSKVETGIIREKKTVPKRKFTVDSPESVKKYISSKLSVGRKQFMLGYKEHIMKPLISLEDEIASQVMLEAVFGVSTDFYKQMLDDGLISLDFSAFLFNGYGFSVFMFGGGSDDPEKTVKAIKDRINQVKENGIPADDFERAKRKIYGKFVMLYNEIDVSANYLVRLYFTGYEPFAEMNIIRDLTVEKAEKRLACLNEEGCALSVIEPMDK